MTADVLRVFRSAARRSAAEVAVEAPALLGPGTAILVSTPSAHRLTSVEEPVDETAFELRAWAPDPDAPAEARWVQDGVDGWVSLSTTRSIDPPDGYEQVETVELLEALPRSYLLWGRVIESGPTELVLAEHRIGAFTVPRSLVTGDPVPGDRLAFAARELVSALDRGGAVWEGNAVIADELLCGLEVASSSPEEPR